jgi:hypothetical protein
MGRENRTWRPPWQGEAGRPRRTVAFAGARFPDRREADRHRSRPDHARGNVVSARDRIVFSAAIHSLTFRPLANRPPDSHALTIFHPFPTRSEPFADASSGSPTAVAPSGGRAPPTFACRSGATAPARVDSQCACGIVRVRFTPVATNQESNRARASCADRRRDRRAALAECVSHGAIL